MKKIIYTVLFLTLILFSSFNYVYADDPNTVCGSYPNHAPINNGRCDPAAPPIRVCDPNPNPDCQYIPYNCEDSLKKDNTGAEIYCSTTNGHHEKDCGYANQSNSIAGDDTSGCNKSGNSGGQNGSSSVDTIFSPIKAPYDIGKVSLSDFISNLIDLFYTISSIVLLFMLLLAGFEWLTSGGDKEKLAKARSRIINAIIGIIIIALAFIITNQIILPILGLKSLTGDSSPATEDTSGAKKDPAVKPAQDTPANPAPAQPAGGDPPG